MGFIYKSSQEAGYAQCQKLLKLGMDYKSQMLTMVLEYAHQHLPDCPKSPSLVGFYIPYIAIHSRAHPMTDPWCWYSNANIHLGYIDGIHGTPYIAAPLGSYGYGNVYGTVVHPRNRSESVMR